MIEKDIDIFSKITNYSIPKWNDLPEIDLYMDQVIALMEKYLTDNSSKDSKLVTQSMINNYVKLGIMPAPIKKKYSREHLAYLFIICSLKQVMPISIIKSMIEEKLKKNSISEILNFYSDLYDFAFHTLTQHLASSESNLESIEDAALFSAIAAVNCRNISNKLFDINHPQKIENTSKGKKKNKGDN